MVRISLAMIVKNEERWLKQSLGSAQPAVDEMIVVDTGSSDGSPTLAEQLGAKLYHIPWQNDFSLAKNCALDRATGDWVLVLDADEELDPSGRGALRNLVETARVDAIQLRVRSLTPQDEIARYDDLHITRLFRNRPAFRYEGKVHEQILPSIQRSGGTVAVSDLTILHYGYQHTTAQGGQSRAARNLEVLEDALKASPDDPYLLYQTGATLMAMGQDMPAANYLARAAELNDGLLALEVQERLYTKMAQLAMRREDYDGARQLVGVSLRLNPANPIAGYVAGVASAFVGDFAAAHAHLKAVKGNPLANLGNDEEIDTVLAFCESQLRAGS